MRRWIVVPAVAAALFGLTACTGDDGDQNTDGGPPVLAPGKPGEPNRTLSPEEAEKSAPKDKPNDADYGFMQDMIVHHSQAIEMTDVAAKSAVARKVKAIADRIADAQGPEIDAMNRWLEKNGREKLNVPGAKEFDEHAQHEHGGAGHDSMPGMASEAEMEQLSSARGAKFDQLFLKLMIAHHEGALTMAETVQQKGTDVVVQQMADEVIATQSAEIARMKAMQQPG